MPRLAELLADRAELRVPLELGEISAVYRPQVVTGTFQTSIVEAERKGDLQGSLYGPVSEALVSWDLERDDGSVYPLTAEGLMEVPKVVLESVLLAMLMAARPNPQTLARSSSGSAARAG